MNDRLSRRDLIAAGALAVGVLAWQRVPEQTPQGFHWDSRGKTNRDRISALRQLAKHRS